MSDYLTVHNRLVAAFTEARVGGLHVDLQQHFYAGRERAFAGANELAIELREVAVPNYWVAYTLAWGINSFSEFKECDLPRSAKIAKEVQVSDNEFVFQKDDQALFGLNAVKAEIVIKSDNVDTLLVTGVMHDQCVRDTAVSAVSRGFNAYIVLDATDSKLHDSDYYHCSLLSRVPEELHGNIGITSINNVRDAMRVGLAERGCSPS